MPQTLTISLTIRLSAESIVTIMGIHFVIWSRAHVFKFPSLGAVGRVLLHGASHGRERERVKILSLNEQKGKAGIF